MSQPESGLTTHSTGLAISWHFINQVNSSPVNSGVRRRYHGIITKTWFSLTRRVFFSFVYLSLRRSHMLKLTLCVLVILAATLTSAHKSPSGTGGCIRCGVNDAMQQSRLSTADIIDQQATLGDTSTNGPAMAVDAADKYVLAWTGTGNFQLNFMSHSPNSGWGPKIVSNETSNVAPAMAYFNGQYVVAWIGVGNNQIKDRKSVV